MWAVAGNLRAKYLRLIAYSSLLSMGSAVATLYLLYSINEIVGSGFKRGGNDIFINGVLALLALFIISGLMQHFMARLGAGGLADLRRTVSRQAILVGYEEFVGKRKFILGALIGDISRIAPLFMLGPQFIYNMLLFIACCGYLLYLSPSMFLVLLVGLLLQSINSYFTFKYTRRYSEKMRGSEDELYDSFSAIGAGKKEMLLSATRQKIFTEQTLLPNIKKAEYLTNKVYWYWGMNGTWGMIIIYAFLFLVMYSGLNFLSLPNQTVMKFVVGVFFIIGPFTFIMNTGAPVIFGLSSIYRLKNMGLFTGRLSSIDDSPVSPVTSNLDNWKRIRLKDVTYIYRDNEGHQIQLGPYDFDIHRGEIIFIVGGNGSGKTTLLLLLSSLLEPSSGYIEIDGVQIPEVIEPYRALFAGVFNDFYLFDQVIDAQGNSASDMAVNQMLNKFGLGNKVDYQGGMFSSLELSTGQRKRLALLQSYIDNRDIYFFDEWAADQDPEFRSHFYKTLLPELQAQGKTIIAISHDEQYFSYADRVVKLREGLTIV